MMVEEGTLQIGEDEAFFGSEGSRWRLSYRVHGSTLVLHAVDGCHACGPAFLHHADALRSKHDVERIRIPRPLAREVDLPTRGWIPADDGLELPISSMLQLREPWLSPKLHTVVPEHRVEDDCPHGWHPRRPRMPDGLVYSKQLASTGELFALQRATVPDHGGFFHRWQNAPHVAAAWNEEGSRQQHDAYLQDRREDPHIEPLIGSLDGAPFAYIEVYWAREDRIGPHCDPGPYDQGLHLLVGEPSYLGGARTAAWMRATFHFMFLREPRTARLVGEPDAGNERVLARLRQTGWRKQREFAFPHKQAALVTMGRRGFFLGELP